MDGASDDAEFCTMPALATQHLKLTFHGHGAQRRWRRGRFSALAAGDPDFPGVDAMRLHLRTDRGFTASSPTAGRR